MKLLITTQIVDIKHDNLGFFHGWIVEFAKRYDEVTVICLQRGEYDFPDNVKVLSLGKDDNFKFKILNLKLFTKLKYILKFYSCIWQQRNNYDHVFVHMNPEYVVLGGLFWRMWGKRIGLWYTHKSVDLKLKLAEKLTHIVFTASRDSFRIDSKKTRVVGHGIEIEKFDLVESSKSKSRKMAVPSRDMVKNQKSEIKDQNEEDKEMHSISEFPLYEGGARRGSAFAEDTARQGGCVTDMPVCRTTGRNDRNSFKIIAVGRITPSKDLEVLIRAVDILCRDEVLKQLIRVEIIGGTLLASDEEYLARLKKLVSDKGLENNINFVGPVPSNKIYDYFDQAQVLAHMSKTGSLDKVFLEAMASSTIPISCNDSSREILNEFGEDFVYDIGDYEVLAKNLRKVIEMEKDKKNEICNRLVDIVKKEHSLRGLILKIRNSFNLKKH